MATAETSDESILKQLDWKSQEILQAISELGGQATTSEIKQRTSINNNDHITHRYRRAAVALEPSGLIEVYEPEVTATERNQPLEVALTEKGETLAERISERGTRSNDLVERLERVEATVETLEATIDEQSTEIPANEGETDIEARLTAVEQRLETLEEALTSEYGAWSAEKQQEYQLVADGVRGIRDFLRETHGDAFKQSLTKHLDG